MIRRLATEAGMAVLYFIAYVALLPLLMTVRGVS